MALLNILANKITHEIIEPIEKQLEKKMNCLMAQLNEHPTFWYKGNQYVLDAGRLDSLCSNLKLIMINFIGTQTGIALRDSIDDSIDDEMLETAALTGQDWITLEHGVYPFLEQEDAYFFPQEVLYQDCIDLEKNNFINKNHIYTMKRIFFLMSFFITACTRAIQIAGLMNQKIKFD